MRYDPTNRGNVRELKVSMDNKILIVNFNNGSILLFSIHDRCDISLLQEINPQADSSIDNHPLNTALYIDDYCTMVSYMSSNRKEINLLAFDWAYSCKRMVKHSVLEKLLESKTMRPLERKKAEPEVIVEKKKTCVIF